MADGAIVSMQVQTRKNHLEVQTRKNTEPPRWYGWFCEDLSKDFLVVHSVKTIHSEVMLGLLNVYNPKARIRTILCIITAAKLPLPKKTGKSVNIWKSNLRIQKVWGIAKVIKNLFNWEIISEKYIFLIIFFLNWRQELNMTLDLYNSTTLLL